MSAKYQVLNGSPPTRRSTRPWIILSLFLLILCGSSFHFHYHLTTPLVSPPPPSIHVPAHGSCGVTGGPGVWTRHLGGTPGFQVFENVWLRDGIFYMFSEDPKAFPPHEEVLTPHTTMVIEAESPNAFTPEHCFPGTTVFMNEGAGPEWSGLSGYYGFVVENVMGAYAALASVFPGNPIQTDRGIIAWNRSWRDDWVNRDVAAALWGENIIGPDYFAHLGSEEEKWMYFERIVIVDRWAAHRSSPLVDLWNKMGVNVFTAPHSANFWDAARSSVIEFMNARAPRRRSSHNIVYLDRQHTRRRLSTRDHDAVVHTLASVAQQKGAAFRHLVTGNMTVSEQIREISQATILVGVHGEAFTSVVWAQPRASLIELFPLDVFTREYELPATALGMEYTAIRGRHVITPEMWQADPGTKHLTKLYDGTATPLYAPLLADTVRAAADKPL